MGNEKPTIIENNLSAVTETIRKAEIKFGRAESSVTLLAVSKKKPAAAIRAAFAAGQLHFGENYVDEASEKIHELRDLPCIWHYIGAIQSNKTKTIAEHFSWVHSVDRIKIAQRLSAQRPSHLGPLNICIQFKFDAEESKAGVAREGLDEICQIVSSLPNLALRGLMVIPAPRETESDQIEAFSQIHKVFSTLRNTYSAMDTLSMGMSADMEAAISQGSTMVRIGTAIFGVRE